MTFYRFLSVLREEWSGTFAGRHASPFFRFGGHDALFALGENVIAALIVLRLTGWKEPDDVATMALIFGAVYPLTLLLRLRTDDQREAMLTDLWLTGASPERLLVGIVLRPLRLVLLSLLPWLLAVALSDFRRTSPPITASELLMLTGVLALIAGAWLGSLAIMLRRLVARRSGLAAHAISYAYGIGFQGLIMAGVLTCLALATDMGVRSRGLEETMIAGACLFTTAIGLRLLVARMVYDGPALLAAPFDDAELRRLRWWEAERHSAEPKVRSAAEDALARREQWRWAAAAVGGAVLAFALLFPLGRLVAAQRGFSDATVWLPGDYMSTNVRGPEEEAVAREVVRFLALHGFQMMMAFGLLAPTLTALLLARPFVRGAMPVEPRLIRPFLVRTVTTATVPFALGLGLWMISLGGLRRTSNEENLLIGFLTFALVAPAAIPAAATVLLSLAPQRTRLLRALLWGLAALLLQTVPLLCNTYLNRRDFVYYEPEWPGTIPPALWLMVPLLGLLYFNRRFLDDLHRELTATEPLP